MGDPIWGVTHDPTTGVRTRANLNHSQRNQPPISKASLVIGIDRPKDEESSMALNGARA